MEKNSIRAMARGGMERLAVFFRFEAMGLLRWRRLQKTRNDRVRRIAFFSYDAHLAQMYKPIIEELRKTRSIEIIFVVTFHPFYGFSGLHRLHEYATDTLGFAPDRVLFYWQATWLSFDAIITNDVYGNLPIQRSKRILMSHGVGFTPRKVKKSPLRKTIYDFDHLFFVGDFDYSLAKPYLRQRHRAYVVGFPFFDELANESLGSDPEVSPALRRGTACELSENPGTEVRVSPKVYSKTVLYAPSWMTADLLGKGSALLFEQIVDVILATGALLIIKLHAVAVNDQQARGSSWHNAVAKYRGHRRVEIAVGDDDQPYFARADVLVSDISGRAFTFMILDRPILLLKVPGYESTHPLIARIQQEMYKAAVPFEQPDDLKELLQRSFEMPGEHSEARKQVVRHVLQNPGSAAGIAARTIMEIADSGPAGASTADSRSEIRRRS